MPAVHLNELVRLIDSGKLRMNLAKSALDKMIETGKPVTEVVSEEDMAGVDDSALLALCEQAISANPNAVSDYLGGKEKALKALVGFVMKATRGTADAAAAEKKLIELVRK